MKPTAIKNYRGVVFQKEQFSPRVYLYTVKLKDPTTISFVPGQFINIDIGGGLHRQYSIASTPKSHAQIQLLVDLGPGGPGSKFFSRLEEGDTLSFRGPLGRFGLATDEGNIVFLSANTGIAPLKSMLDMTFEEQAQKKDYDKRRLYLYQTFRHEEDVYWDEYFETAEEEHPNFHYLLTLSQPKPTWNGCQGYVQACMDRQLLRSKESNFYVCGGARMVEGVLKYLRENNVAEDKIHFEPF